MLLNPIGGIGLRGPGEGRWGDDSDLVVGVFPVFLDIRLFNTSKENSSSVEQKLLVEESFPDLEPILQLRDTSVSGGVTCEIVNFAVNRVDECEIAFNILPPKAQPKFENYQFVEKVESFSERAKSPWQRRWTRWEWTQTLLSLLRLSATTTVRGRQRCSARRAPSAHSQSLRRRGMSVLLLA